jgi:hypothetical protein
MSLVSQSVVSVMEREDVRMGRKEWVVLVVLVATLVLSALTGNLAWLLHVLPHLV